MSENPLSVGLIVPINNSTMESEMLARLPRGSACRTLGIPRGKGMLKPEDLPAYLAQTIRMARTFAADDIDMVVYGCTAAGFMAGPERDTEVAAEISNVTGKPVITTAGAMTAALAHIGARNIALVTPYLDLVNQRLKSFLAASGISVEVLASFRAQTVDELASIAPAQISALARAVMRESCDSLFIACSQLPTMTLVEDLECELGRPVWSSIKATVWQAMRHGEIRGAKGGRTQKEVV